MVRGLHLTEEGLNYILAIKSRMNNARLSTTLNNPKYQILPIPNYDPFKLNSVYELTSEGAIRELATQKYVTNVQYYKLTDVQNLNHFVFLKPSEIVDFFGYSRFTVYKAIKTNKSLMRTETGISYFISRIF